ncbi:MAG: hypothetical protein GF334_07890 [Candidatus Altiarchaeales archaeon]|nr:hypothetical protein [Candidatus Altiarchaeales archaeon]
MNLEKKNQTPDLLPQPLSMNEALDVGESLAEYSGHGDPPRFKLGGREYALRLDLVEPFTDHRRMDLRVMHGGLLAGYILKTRFYRGNRIETTGYIGTVNYPEMLEAVGASQDPLTLGT